MDARKGIVATRNEMAAQQQERLSIPKLLNNTLDNSGYKRRFDELLGKRAPQFVSSLAALINSTPQVLTIFQNNPVAIIQSALKAAAYDLPIEPSLGYAYILPFGQTATFVLGYKGMVQLALRTGLYMRLNAVDVREGELISYDRLTEDIEFRWEADNAKRAKIPVIGYAAFYRLKNGMEKTLFMTKAEIDAHELANRKGRSQNPVWRNHYDEMAKKTVLRRLLSKWGIMSINYLDASPADQEVMRNMAEGTLDDTEMPQERTIENSPNLAPVSPAEPAEAITIPWEQGNAQEGKNQAVSGEAMNGGEGK